MRMVVGIIVFAVVIIGCIIATYAAIESLKEYKKNDKR